MAHAAGDAHPYPIYGAHFLVTFPMLDADGDLVTGATTPDAEVSKDLGTFTDCTNESTELATNSGVYYLYLTGAEMTAKIVTVIAKSATAGMKTTTLTIHPIRLPILESDVAEGGAASTITLAAATASAKDHFYEGMFVHITDNDAAGSQYQARRIIGYVGSTRVATVDSAWGTNPTSSSNYDILIPEGAAAKVWGGGKIPDPTVAGVPNVNAKTWNDLTTVALPLVPTTAGRTLDVSAGGEGGVDWANVGSPTTVVGLSGTTVKTATDIATQITAVLGALADAAADGDPTATDTAMAYIKQIINTLEGSAGIPAWAAAAAPANAVSLAEAIRSIYTQIGVAGAGLTAADDAVIAAIGTLQSDTDDIQTRLPAALVGGRMDSSVGAMAANTMTAAAAAADLSTEINTAVLAVLGALNDAAADGDPTTTDTVVAYIKQIINTLEGTAGIPAWAAAAAPANAVSLAEAIRSIYTQIGVAGAGLTAADDAVITAIAGVAAQLPTALTAGGNIKADVIAVSGDTTAADKLEALMDGTLVVAVNDAGATSTVFITDLTEATNDHYKGRLVTFLTGALIGQQTAITAYNGGTKALTVTAMTEAPANGDVFVVH